MVPVGRHPTEPRGPNRRQLFSHTTSTLQYNLETNNIYTITLTIYRIRSDY